MQQRTPDLRRSERDLADQIVLRAEHLPAEERALVRSIYADGRTIDDVAALLQADPRQVRRRVRRLVRRVLSDRYIFVVRHRDSWPCMRRRLATACIIHGHSLKHAAVEVGTSFYNTRKHLDAVHALLDSIRHGKFTTEAPRHREDPD